MVVRIMKTFPNMRNKYWLSIEKILIKGIEQAAVKKVSFYFPCTYVRFYFK